MAKFYQNIKPYVEAEFAVADTKMQRGDSAQAFEHLENAHILGQHSTRLHVKSHYKMLIWAIKFNQYSELFGQIFRLVGAATKTYFGYIPQGNSGGANVSPLQSLPLSAEHEKIINKCTTKA